MPQELEDILTAIREAETDEDRRNAVRAFNDWKHLHNGI